MNRRCVVAPDPGLSYAKSKGHCLTESLFMISLAATTARGPEFLYRFHFDCKVLSVLKAVPGLPFTLACCFLPIANWYYKSRKRKECIEENPATVFNPDRMMNDRTSRRANL